jgi:hypothetical protein
MNHSIGGGKISVLQKELRGGNESEKEPHPPQMRPRRATHRALRCHKSSSRFFAIVCDYMSDYENRQPTTPAIEIALLHRQVSLR